MRVDDCRVEDRPAGTERSVRLAWIGGEARLWVRVPHGAAPPPEDLSAFLSVALFLAKRRSEPLQVDGAVSPALLERLTTAQEVISAWDPTYAQVQVRVAGLAEPAEPAAGRASCFSRGVDSMYSAAAPRTPPLTHLLHCDTLDPTSPETRRLEVEAVGGAAERLGTELVVVSTNVHELLRGVVDYDDAHGAVLAMLGLSLPGLIGRLTIPSTMDYGHLVPNGSHPLLDPLWSTESVAVEHDSCALGRQAKVRWLVEQRPDLVPLLRVCWMKDSTENCGRCSKCQLTMVALAAVDALAGAGSFPPRLDLDALRRMRWPDLQVQLYVNDLLRAIPDDPAHDELRSQLEELQRKSARAPADYSSFGISPHQTRLYRAVLEGRPYPAGGGSGRAPAAEVDALDPSWPPPRDVPQGLLGLTVGIDLPGRRHVYGLGAVPPGRFAGELGAALAEGGDGRVPLRLPPARGDWRREGPAWALAPLGYRGAGRRDRLRAAGRRALDVLRGRRGERPDLTTEAWLHAEPGPGRLPLFAAPHPVLHDVLLATDPDVPRRLGYREPELLGHLEERAPLTGRLKVHRGGIPWARFGS